MNRLPPTGELAARRPDWTEGTWIALSDGQEWNFPPTTAIPGYDQVATAAARVALKSIMSLVAASPNTVKHVQNAIAGDPAKLVETIGHILGVHQVAYWAGSTLLKRNYDLTDEDCDRLMPFNYQLADLADPESKLHRAIPQTLATCNRIAALSGINIGPLLQDMSRDN